MIRTLIAALVGGLVMFCWGAFFHMAMPFGDGGVKSAPDEPAIVSALEGNLKEPGFYFIPGMENMHNASEEEQAAWTAKYEKGPTAIVVYHPAGETPMSPRHLATEFGSNVLAALFIAVIMGFSGAGYIRRVEIAALVGAAAWASISLSQWNWYRFPTSMLMADGIEQIGGWLIAGIVMAFFVKRREMK